MARCKFQIRELTKGYMDTSERLQPSGEWKPVRIETVGMSAYPVYDSDKNTENGKFFAATPNGEFKIQVVNAAALEGLEPGDEIYIDITKVQPLIPQTT